MGMKMRSLLPKPPTLKTMLPKLPTLPKPRQAMQGGFGKSQGAFGVFGRKGGS